MTRCLRSSYSLSEIPPFPSGPEPGLGGDLAQGPGEAPDFVKPVVKRVGSRADHVGLPEVGHYSRLLQRLQDFPGLSWDAQRELAAPRRRFARGDHLAERGVQAIQQALETAGQGNRFLP